MQRSLLIFENSIHSPETKRVYLWALNKFMEFYKLKDYDSMAKMEQKMLQVMIEDYIMTLKSQGKKRQRISTSVSSLELFCDINDIMINWKKIRRLLPRAEKKTGSKPYTTKQVARMLEYEPKLRNKAIIHVLASSGMRIGGLSDIKLKHVRDIENCKVLTVYPDDKEEYMTFLTPEASRMVDEYIEKRKADGEYLGPESPLFREYYSIGIAKAKAIKRTAFQAVILRAIRRCGIRTDNTGKRRDVMLDHGFRKRWNTIVKNTDGIKIILVEKMMGHTIQTIPLDQTYNVPDELRLFTEFKKAIPELTVDNTARKQAELDAKEQENSELRQVIKEKDDLAIRVAKIEADNERKSKTRE